MTHHRAMARLNLVVRYWDVRYSDAAHLVHAARWVHAEHWAHEGSGAREIRPRACKVTPCGSHTTSRATQVASCSAASIRHRFVATRNRMEIRAPAIIIHR